MKHIMILLLSVTLSACSIVPNEIDTANEALVSYSVVKQNTQTYLGKEARWGGIIANIDNQADYTVIEVVNLALDYQARPKESNQSAGRFLAYYHDFLDPMIYKKGKHITVLGNVEPAVEGKIGEQKYLYPTLKVSGLHIWKEIQKMDLRVRSDFPNHHWNHYPYSPQPRVVVIHQNKTNNKK